MHRTKPASTTPAERFRSTLDLIQVGVSLMRQNIRRSNPGLGDEALDARLQEWLWRHPVEAPRDLSLQLVSPSRLQ